MKPSLKTNPAQIFPSEDLGARTTTSLHCLGTSCKKSSVTKRRWFYPAKTKSKSPHHPLKKTTNPKTLWRRSLILSGSLNIYQSKKNFLVAKKTKKLANSHVSPSILLIILGCLIGHFKPFEKNVRQIGSSPHESGWKMTQKICWNNHLDRISWYRLGWGGWLGARPCHSNPGKFHKEKSGKPHGATSRTCSRWAKPSAVSRGKSTSKSWRKWRNQPMEKRPRLGILHV